LNESREQPAAAAVFLRETRILGTCWSPGPGAARRIVPTLEGDMASQDQTSSSTALRLVADPGFRINARIYASDAVIDVLASVVTERQLAVVVDVDALEHTTARIDRVMRLALDALCHANVQVVLLVRHQHERAASVHAGLTGAWRCEHGDARWTLARLRERLPGVPLVAISDDPALLDNLSGRDRGIAIGPVRPAARRNIAPSGAFNVRAALWWIVDARWKAGLVAWA
jgi:hypothetical protein